MDLNTILQMVQNGMALALILGIIVIGAIIWNLHKDKDNQVDIKDLICANGKLSERKFTRFSAWMVSTWAFVYLVIDNRFSEWFFAGYMAIWTGNALFSKWLDQHPGPTKNSEADKKSE